jgi:hypothetical protein
MINVVDVFFLCLSILITIRTKLQCIMCYIPFYWRILCQLYSHHQYNHFHSGCVGPDYKVCLTTNWRIPLLLILYGTESLHQCMVISPGNLYTKLQILFLQFAVYQGYTTPQLFVSDLAYCWLHISSIFGLCVTLQEFCNILLPRNRAQNLQKYHVGHLKRQPLKIDQITLK